MSAPPDYPLTPEDTGAGLTRRLLSQKEYARLKGWSKQYVNQLVRQGRIALRDGKVDPSDADTALARTRDPARLANRQSEPQGTQVSSIDPTGEPSSLTPHGSFGKARTVHEHYRALRKKLEYAQRGRMVDAEGVQQAAYEIGCRVREVMLASADQIAEAIAGELGGDGGRAKEVATKEARAALERLAHEVDSERWGFRRGLEAGRD